MKIAFILLLAAFVLLIIKYARYRRQIADICRQLAFHRREKSNIDIRTSLDCHEIIELRDCVNGVLTDARNECAHYIQQETHTKELITDLAHDIRTPLTSLDGYFDLLCDADLHDEREKYKNIITERLRLLWDLLEQLFTYAKLQNGSYKPEIETFDCGQMLCDILLSFYEDFRLRGIEPNIDILDSECMILGDKVAFGRVVQNILRNALLHGRDSISISMCATATKVVFTFRNNLDGDWSGDINKVFERFYTADKSRTNHSSGLGLPVARQLTEAMNGKISADVSDGNFMIRLEFLRQ